MVSDFAIVEMATEIVPIPKGALCHVAVLLRAIKIISQESCVNLAPWFPHMKRGTEPNTTFDNTFAHRCE